MTQAIHTQGTKLQRGDGAGPEVFTTIAVVISFTGPTETAKQVDVTSLELGPAPGPPGAPATPVTSVTAGVRGISGACRAASRLP